MSKDRNEINNFKKLEELEVNRLSVDFKPIKERFSSNVGFVSFISKVVELYLPRVAEIFITMSGGQLKEDRPPNLEIPEDDKLDFPEGPKDHNHIN